jgi:hypothetical protein
MTTRKTKTEATTEADPLPGDNKKSKNKGDDRSRSPFGDDNKKNKSKGNDRSRSSRFAEG